MTTAHEISVKDLPYWMLQARRGVDWGVILVVVFSLLMAWPFILQPGLPHTNASANYVYRTADYAQAFQEGRLYPRWSPHVFGGYGAPIPHYYPPAAPYMAALVQVFFTGDPVTAIRIVYIAALCMCGSMMYVFVTRRSGSAAGVLASFLYTTSPYMGLTAPHLLGDLPGVIMLALFPTLLWAVDRLLILNRPHDVLLVSLTVSALILTGPRDSVPALSLAALLALWHWLTIDRHAKVSLVISTVVLGVGIAAFFWLPTLWEQSLVHWRTPLNVSSLHLSLETLLSPVTQIDLAEMIPSPQLAIGVIPLLAAVFGAIGAGLGRRAGYFQLLFLIAGLAITALALTLFPADVWLMGPIAFCLAIVGSGMIHLLMRFPTVERRVFLPTLLVIAFIGSLPVWLAPRWADAFGSTDPQAQIQYEQHSNGVAVVPPHLPVPATISETLASNRTLLEGYTTGNVSRIPLGQLPSNVRVGVLEHNGHSQRFQVSLTRPTVLNLLSAHFPGWQATVAGRPVPLTRDEQTGLMHVDTPVARNEELVVFLGPTPVRTGAWAISWATLAILLTLTVVRFRRNTGSHDDLALLTIPEARLLAVVMGCFGLIILMFATPTSPLTVRTRPGYRLDNSYSLRSRTDVGLEAIAYRLERFAYRPGETLELTLYWQTARPLASDYQIQTYLLSADGIHWLPSTFTRPGSYPTSQWQTNRYVRDEHFIPLSLGVAPGTYRVAIEVSACSPGCTSAISFFDSNGGLLGQTLFLPSPITISP
jgi:hypothetical protein